MDSHPGVELRANLKSISHRCHLFEVAFVWELTKETIHLPLGCLQGGDLVGVDVATLEGIHVLLQHLHLPHNTGLAFILCTGLAFIL